jgi:hypothetical protein
MQTSTRASSKAWRIVGLFAALFLGWLNVDIGHTFALRRKCVAACVSELRSGVLFVAGGKSAFLTEHCDERCIRDNSTFFNVVSSLEDAAAPSFRESRGRAADATWVLMALAILFVPLVCGAYAMNKMAATFSPFPAFFVRVAAVALIVGVFVVTRIHF